MSSSPHPQAKARYWIAIVAAYLVALQGLLGAAQAGYALGLTSLDRQIHQTLCAPGAETSPRGDGASDEKLPACCAAACATTTAAYAPPPPDGPLRFEPSQIATPELPAWQTSPDRRDGHLAARPRGPPLSA